jgi:hypothetical protein
MTAISVDNKFNMNAILYGLFQKATKVIKNDWDMIFCIDGFEGTGKSVFAMQCAYVCDNTLTNDRVVFTSNAFRKAVIAAKPYQAVIYDEAYTGLSSRSTMSFINKALVSMLAEIRQKNLFVFVVMPTFFDLDKYVALWRSRALIHVYTSDDFERGFFAWFDRDKKKDLYILGKKFYTYSNVKPNFTGRFVNYYTVDEIEYRNNKKNSLTAREQAAIDKEKDRELQELLFDKLISIGDIITHKIKMQLLDMPSSTYFLKLKHYEEK